MKQVDKINTEQAIIQAAEKIFLVKGYERTKATEIAREAGVTHAMLHYYFRTKENLFDQVFRQKLGLVAESLCVVFQEDLPFLERVRKGVEAHFDLIASNQGLPRFILNEIIGSTERVEVCKRIILPTFGCVMENLKEAIKQEVDRGTIRPIDPIDLILNIISLNVFVFLASPLVNMFTELEAKNYQAFLEHRKRMNVELILKGLEI